MTQKPSKRVVKRRSRRAVSPLPKRLALYKLTKPWARLTEAQRKTLVGKGFDEYSWDNNVRETVQVEDHELIYVGGESTLLTGVRVTRNGPRRKYLVDEDAFRLSSWFA